MIYLRTGANGSGKTLLTLRDVREKSLKENRPVYHNGRFELVAEFGWTKIDTKDWQSVPDGAIFIIDECQHDFPVRRTGEPVPDYVKAMAEHRRRGFDFYLITQHPLNFDSFVRRLIGAPGWHQHLKRASGAPLVSVLEWPAVNEVCQKAGSGASGSTSMVSYPKEVYKWYVSTSLDTAKVKVPFQVKVLIACLLILPVIGYYFWQNIAARTKPKPAPAAAVSGPLAGAHPVTGVGDKPAALTPAEYVATYTPRVVGLAYTAPRYDDLTKPVAAPFPAGCIVTADRCQCYTDQGTKLPVPLGLCIQIAKDGYFRDWGNGPAMASGSGSSKLVVPNGAVLDRPSASDKPMSAASSTLAAL